MDNNAQFILAIDRRDLFTDYEHFVVPIKRVKQPKQSFFDHNKVILEFNKGSFIEVITGYRFVRVDDNTYYNVNTGLYFSLSVFPQCISFRSALEYLCDCNYAYGKGIRKLFKYHEEVNNKDKELRAKGNKLLLSKPVKQVVK